ncbi:MAG TPA: DoxX family protein [Cyclobacteriaceae bacterium]|nr:DoxX family protein [Cyclobacteriaceae bacterium]
MSTLNATLTGAASSKGKVWTGRVMAGIVILFMLVDSIFKLVPNEQVIEGTTSLGFQLHHLPIMGALGLLSVILYIIPRTEFLGAILLTGYWGGAMVTHVRLDNPLFTHVLFTVYFGILAWGALYLKNEKFRDLILGRG